MKDSSHRTVALILLLVYDFWYDLSTETMSSVDITIQEDEIDFVTGGLV